MHPRPCPEIYTSREEHWKHRMRTLAQLDLGKEDLTRRLFRQGFDKYNALLGSSLGVEDQPQLVEGVPNTLLVQLAEYAAGHLYMEHDWVIVDLDSDLDCDPE